MSERWPGGIINQTAPTFPYSGVWTLEQVAYLQSQNLWPIYTPADPYFYDVTLLLNGDGTNGAQNNTFLDSSTNNFTITRNGNTTQGSFSPYGNLWSNYFGGAGNYLTLAANSAWSLPGDFTWECWAYPTSASADARILHQGSTSTQKMIFYMTSGAGLNFYYDGGANYIVSSIGLKLNAWNHIAGVRNGSTITIYINGVSGGTASSSATLGDSSLGFAIGSNGGSTDPFPGYISNVRLVKGTAVYTTTFTPPTTPLTAITNTTLLTCQSNRFIDNSSNAFALTVSGSPSVQRFSPFNPTAPYSTSVIGGSGYFDGSTSYLNNTTQVTNQFTPGSAFTFEFWIYQTATQAIVFQVQGSSNDWNASTGILFSCYANYSGTFYWQFSRGNGTEWNLTGTGVPTNQWCHVAIGYNGSTTRAWVNGTSIGTSTNGYSIPSYSKFSIGNNCVGTGGSYLAGNMSDVRFVKGVDVYGVGNSTITVPTAPLTAISGTSLLTGFTNAGIPDLAMQNNLQTVGNAQVSTSVKKYGTGSLSFGGGSGNYLTSNPANSSLYAFGTGDFTIEMWIYVNSLPGTDMVLYDGRPSNGAYPCIILQGSTNKLLWYVNSTIQITSSNAVTTGTWFHLAISRVGTSTAMFINGNQSGSIWSDSTNYLGSATRPYIGANATNGNESFNGYIDDLRITNGLARYTTTFTPPTAALPTY